MCSNSLKAFVPIILNFACVLDIIGGLAHALIFESLDDFYLILFCIFISFINFIIIFFIFFFFFGGGGGFKY